MCPRKLMFTTYKHFNNEHHLGDKSVSSILVLHSCTGCNTVSRIFGVGQDKVLNIRKKLSEADILMFFRPTATKEEVKFAAENFFLSC